MARYMSGKNGGNHYQIALQHLLSNMEGETILWCGVVWGEMELESLWRFRGRWMLSNIVKFWRMVWRKALKSWREHYIQQDNDPKHTSKWAKQWFSDNNIQVLEWPAQSPDLNLIEHLWHHLKSQFQQYNTPPKGVHELWERVVEEWNRISLEVCLGGYKQLSGQMGVIPSIK